MTATALAAILPSIRDPELEYLKYRNFLIALRERRRRAVMLSSLPFGYMADISTACQLKCVYCPTGRKELGRPIMHLSPETNAQILTAIGDVSFAAWYFCLGEPLLNPRCTEIIAAAAKREIFTVISTNLSMPLSDARIDAILQSGLGVLSVSLDGASPETYVRYRRGGDFALITENMRRLARRKRQLGLERPVLEWRFLLFQHNQHETELARQMVDDLGADNLEFYYGMTLDGAPPDGVHAATASLSGPGESGAAMQAGLRRTDTRIRRSLGERLCWAPFEAPAPVLRKKCDWHYYGMAVRPDGRVGPCDVVSQEADDFGVLSADEDLTQIWNNEKYQLARQIFRGERPGADLVCARCDIPKVMDLFFQNCVNGVLANAPDWTLAALTADPAAYFMEVDPVLVPSVKQLLQFRRDEFGAFPKIAARLQRDAKVSPQCHADLSAIGRSLA